MSLKLTRAEFTALMDELQCKAIQPPHPNNITGKLIHTIVVGLWLKFAKKQHVVQKDYKIKMTAVEEMAFFMAFRDCQLPPSNFTGNLIIKLKNSIHQKYA